MGIPISTQMIFTLKEVAQTIEYDFSASLLHKLTKFVVLLSSTIVL